MKRLNIILIFSCIIYTQATSQNFHFQEGFATSTPTGWTRLCATTTSLNRGGFTGTYAMQFKSQDDYFGESKYFETPAVNKAGTLTFYASRNAKAVYYDLHICKVINGVSTLIETIPNTSIAQKDSWTKITVPINDPSDNIKIRIWAEDTATSTSYVALDDFSLTSDIDTHLTLSRTSIASGEVCYYNLTKNIVLTFNQEVKAGSGTISLNSVNIPVSSAIIEGLRVTVPLSLTSDKGTNKAQKLVISKNAFVEKNNNIELNANFTLNFETFKKANVPANYGEMIDIPYSDASEAMCRMDFYYPIGATKPTPVLINMHGGGWSEGHKEEQTSFNPFTNTTLGFAVANVEYRMTPQATAPAAVEDVRCAMQYLLRNAVSLNIDPQKIVFQGTSSGAHLALVAGYLQNDRKYDTNCNDYAGEIKILAVINKYGPSELWELKNDAAASSVRNWLGTQQNNETFVKSVSPVHMVNANTPPTYTVHGNSDTTVPKKYSSDLLVAALAKNGVTHQYKTIPGGGHGGFSSSQNQQIENEITSFLQPLLAAIGDIPASTLDVTDNKTLKCWNSGSLIYTSSPCTLDIYTVFGTLVKSLRCDKSVNANLQNGLYFVQLNTDGEQKNIHKILVK